MRKAIFIDKDGTLIRDVPYNIETAKIELYPDSLRFVTEAKASGYLVIVISNQSGVAQGYFPESALKDVYTQLNQLLDYQLDGFYYCPHHPQGSSRDYAIDCGCRKPAPGLLLKAAADWSVDLENSWMIGDILNDVEAGNRAGCKTVLINNGNETEWEKGEYRLPVFTVSDLNEAAGLIFKDSLTDNEQ